MDDMLVLGHRGAPRVARENTIAAFEHAREAGADGVELDVRRTGDGALAVHHDPALASGMVLASATIPELRAEAPWLPVLAEAIDACAGLLVNIEVKNLPNDPDWDPHERLAEWVARLVLTHPHRDELLVSSFNPAALERIHALDPDVRLGLLTPGWFTPDAAIELATARGFEAWHPFDGSLGSDPATPVARAHEAGLAVYVWTVDDPNRIAELDAAGVDAVITNVPDLAVAVRASRR